MGAYDYYLKLASSETLNDYQETMLFTEYTKFPTAAHLLPYMALYKNILQRAVPKAALYARLHLKNPYWPTVSLISRPDVGLKRCLSIAKSKQLNATILKSWNAEAERLKDWRFTKEMYDIVLANLNNGPWAGVSNTVECVTASNKAALTSYRDKFKALYTRQQQDEKAKACVSTSILTKGGTKFNSSLDLRPNEPDPYLQLDPVDKKYMEVAKDATACNNFTRQYCNKPENVQSTYCGCVNAPKQKQQNAQFLQIFGGSGFSPPEGCYPSCKNQSNEFPAYDKLTKNCAMNLTLCKNIIQAIGGETADVNNLDIAQQCKSTYGGSLNPPPPTKPAKPAAGASPPTAAATGKTDKVPPPMKPSSRVPKAADAAKQDHSASVSSTATSSVGSSGNVSLKLSNKQTLILAGGLGGIGFLLLMILLFK